MGTPLPSFVGVKLSNLDWLSQLSVLILINVSSKRLKMTLRQKARQDGEIAMLRRVRLLSARSHLEIRQRI